MLFLFFSTNVIYLCLLSVQFTYFDTQIEIKKESTWITFLNIFAGN